MSRLTPTQASGSVGLVLTTEELAAVLKVSPTQVRRLNLPAVKVGKNRYRYVLEQVLEALKREAA